MQSPDVPPSLLHPPGGMTTRGHIALIKHQLKQVKQGLALVRVELEARVAAMLQSLAPLAEASLAAAGNKTKKQSAVLRGVPLRTQEVRQCHQGRQAARAGAMEQRLPSTQSRRSSASERPSSGAGSEPAPSLRVEPAGGDVFEVSGRGQLHLCPLLADRDEMERRFAEHRVPAL